MKKLFVLLLIIAMLVPNAVFATVQEWSTQERFAEKEFLQMLSIVDSDSIPGQKVTRAEFADMIVKAMNLEASALEANMFADVTASTPHFGEITTAARFGLINGGGSGFFYPDDVITADAALKIAVVALGYEDVAAAYGGYPSGYMRVANDIDLLDGVDISGDFDIDEICMLLYNFLNSDVCLVTSVSADGTLSYKRDNGNTPLNLYFGLKKEEGVIKTAGYVSMVYGYEAENAEIYINGKNFSTELDGIGKFLGTNSAVWYDENKNVAAIYCNDENEYLYAVAKDIGKYDGDTIAIYDEEKNKDIRVNLDPAYTFVKNGRSIHPNEVDFIADGAEFTFIDNNGDKKYDVVISMVPEYMVVSYINAIEGIVFDTNARKQLVLDKESGVHYTLTANDKDGNPVPMYMEDLVEGNVIKYYISDDEKYVEAHMSELRLSGVISEKSDDKVIVDGNEYTVNSYFKDIDKLKFGVNYTLLLASDNTITAIASAKAGEMKYGFLLDFKYSTSGIEKSAMIKILRTDNEIFEGELADKITLDGNNGIEKESADVVRAVCGGAGSVRYQIIRYSLNESGQIDTLDTYETSELAYDKLSDANSEGNNSLTLHHSKTTVFYINETKVLFPKAVIGASTLFISVPTDFSEDASYTSPEKRFSFITISDLGRYGDLTLSMYDVNKSFEPGIVMTYNGISATENVNVAKDASPAVVKSVTRGINSDGESVYYFSLFCGKKAYKLPVSHEKTIKIDEGSGSLSDVIARPGDVIRYVTNVDGEISNYVIDVRYEPESSGKGAYLSASGLSNSLGSSSSNDSVHFGKCYVHSATSISLLKATTADGVVSYIEKPESLSVFKISSPNVILYNHRAKTVRAGSIGMIKDFVSSGEFNSSLIVLKCYDSKPSDIIIYE